MLRWMFLVPTLAWTLPVHASTTTLDYVAAAECPDAARFVAEVSARLGRVPFDGGGDASVRVRVGPDGDAWFATVELPDGTDRVLRGVACHDVVSLAATVAAEYFMFREPPRRRRAGEAEPMEVPSEHASPEPAADGTAAAAPRSHPPNVSPTATAHPATARSIRARFRLRSTGVPPLADLYRAAATEERLCTLPCVAELTPGTLVGLRLDHGSFRALEDLGELHASTDVLVVHRSRRGVRRLGLTLLGIGLTLAVVSFLPLVVSEDANTSAFGGLAGAGLVLLGTGAGLAFVRDRLSVERLPD